MRKCEQYESCTRILDGDIFCMVHFDTERGEDVGEGDFDVETRICGDDGF